MHIQIIVFYEHKYQKLYFWNIEPLKSGDEKRSRLLEIIRKIDIDEDDDLDESELVQERLTKTVFLICQLDS